MASLTFLVKVSTNHSCVQIWLARKVCHQALDLVLFSFSNGLKATTSINISKSRSFAIVFSLRCLLQPNFGLFMPREKGPWMTYMKDLDCPTF
jgi:hypothetical protein